jgi:hypothetical protein
MEGVFELKRAMNVPIGYLQTKIMAGFSVGTQFFVSTEHT